MKNLQRVVTSLFVVALLLALTSGADAATNTATFNIAGSARPDSNTINLNSVNIAGLTLVKGAYLTSDGSPVADGATLPTGTSVDFMIYVDNTTGVALSDINISDTLNALFLYQAGTIRVSNAVNTGATAAAILADVKAAGAVTDANAAGDVAGITGTVVSAGRIGLNDTLNIASGKVWAMVFTVVLQ